MKKKPENCIYADQSILNYFFKKRWKKLDESWNIFFNQTKHPIDNVIHFAFDKPWFKYHTDNNFSLWYTLYDLCNFRYAHVFQFNFLLRLLKIKSYQFIGKFALTKWLYKKIFQKNYKTLIISPFEKDNKKKLLSIINQRLNK